MYKTTTGNNLVDVNPKIIYYIDGEEQKKFPEDDMIKKRDEYTAEIREKMRGGEGSVQIIDLLPPEFSNEKCRLFAKIVLPPKASIGFHNHVGEFEAYYIISGKAVTQDGSANEHTLDPGDGMYTGFGSGHSIRNDEDHDLVFIALILMD